MTLSLLPPEKGVFRSQSLPAVSPDGRRIAFAVTVAGKHQLWIRDANAAAGGPAVAITSLDRTAGEISHRFPWFLPDGRHFLYSVRNTDPAKSAIYIGDLDSTLKQRLFSAESFVSTNIQGQFSVSATGPLTYLSDTSSDNQVSWRNRAGEHSETALAAGAVAYPRISPDGSKVALTRRAPGTPGNGVWIYDLAHGTASRFTFGSRTEASPT